MKFLKIKIDLKKILDFLEIKNMIIKIEKLMNEFDIRFRWKGKERMDWNIVWKKLFRVLFVVWRDKGVGKKKRKMKRMWKYRVRRLCVIYGYVIKKIGIKMIREGIKLYYVRDLGRIENI